MARTPASSNLEGVPPRQLPRLQKLGISSWRDLVFHFPIRYEDQSHLHPIKDAPNGVGVLVEATVIHAETVFRPRKQFLAQVEDGTGTLYVRLLHFYPNQTQQLSEGQRLRLFGEIRDGFYGREMVHPRIKRASAETPLAEALLPVYPTAAGLTQDTLRSLVERALTKVALDDTLGPTIRRQNGLLPFDQALRLIHAPGPEESNLALADRSHPAWRTLAFHELLAQQLSLRAARQERRSQRSIALPSRGTFSRALLAELPFKLTQAQQKVLLEIAADLSAVHPMYRLLQGDVGSGKTIVAALAALIAIENNAQVALMAPTELLAEQHKQKFADWFQAIGLDVTWLAGNQTRKDRRDALQRIRSGATKMIIGTHALFQEAVEFEQLGLVIVDEQHRFGVRQRLALRAKGQQPHQLMMSATPIPRTLAMSFFADLDVSNIDELPPGRTPINTRVISQGRRQEVIERVRVACVEGRQAYWVCPLIEESEILELQAAEQTFELLVSSLPQQKIALVHGKQSSEERLSIMQAFAAQQIDVLVATTVIEVGVDVPNASLMVIEHAERFGLAQLHQLRGRVGRGENASLCLLLFDGPLSAIARERLDIIRNHSDGFVIAQEDLRIRGPGELVGARQAGTPLLKIADLNLDADRIETAQKLAVELLLNHPDTAQAHLNRWLPRSEGLLHS